jgi:calcium-dependent protein kinase
MKPLKIVGEYTLYQQIGEGAFGSVYKATDKYGGLMACKVVALPPAGNREKLYREMGILQKIPSHPNIVRLYHSTETKNNLYLFMEYCDAGDLK